MHERAMPMNGKTQREIERENERAPAHSSIRVIESEWKLNQISFSHLNSA